MISRITQTAEPANQPIQIEALVGAPKARPMLQQMSWMPIAMGMCASIGALTPVAFTGCPAGL